ncbi:MAG: hypothetical protein OXE52_11835 [Chloroflexi bacterium]|nr:hypothetical protein [Chloroflexota bacterium]
MGKSYFVQHEEQRLRASLNDSDDKSLLRNLAGSESGGEVRRRLFDSDTFCVWKIGTHRLTLFVDSVDQAGGHVEDVITIICNELADADVSRLHLRLVCRDHDWSQTLADRLGHVWRSHDGTDGIVRVYQLAPLGLEAIRLAAEANKNTIKDSEQFLQDVEDADALPLATVPVTLEMLLKEPTYLTCSRVELYTHGLKQLCRRAEERTALSTAELQKRFDMASRIAAIMMLSRKHSVNVEADEVLESSSALAVSDLVSEGADENDEGLIRATLDTALFHVRREREWAHKSFVEYLAADCLSDKRIPAEAIVRMTIAPDEKFASDLRDTLRWLIEMRTDVLDEIIKRQPMLVLTTDVSHLNDKEFKKLFTAILSLEDPYVYSHETWSLRSFRASHPSAKGVLLPYLENTGLSQYLRRFVLDLVECLDITDIDDVLVRLALDKQEDQVLRHFAARRLADVGSADAKLQLKPYIFGKVDDPEDDLKGYALQALWPDHLTGDELLNAMSPPKKENYLGSYKMFLFKGYFLDKLCTSDLPVALKWVAAQPRQHEAPISLRDFPGRIMRKAWNNIDAPGVAEVFAETAVAIISCFDGLFNDPPYSYPHNQALDEIEQDFMEKVDKRQELVLKCLQYMSLKDVRAFRLIHCWPPLVVADDLDWLLGLLDSEADELRRKQLAQLVSSLLPRFAGHGENLTERYRNIYKVYGASERYPELKELTQPFFYLKLDDPRAVSEREHHHTIKEIEENQKRQLAEVRPFERLEKALDQIETSETWLWHNVIYSLLHFPDGRSDTWNLEPDLQDFPLWKSCDKETKERIVKAALSFVAVQDSVISDDNGDNWYETGNVPHVELYGYLAIFLLQKTNIELLERWHKDKWQRWSKVIVWYPYMPMYFSDGRTDCLNQTIGLQNGILHRLYQTAPQATLENFRNLIVAKDKHFSIVKQKLEYLWNPAFETMLLGFLQASSLSPKGQRSLLDLLLKNDSSEAMRLAEERIASGYSNQTEKELVVEFSASLMMSTREFNWNLVWQLFRNDDDIGRAIVENVAEADWHAEKFISKLSPPELVDLFIWVEEQYPTSEDPQVEGVHFVTAREQVGNWRNSIISELQKKDSWEALHGIRLILFRFPNLERLQHLWIHLEKAAEGKEWQSPSPREVSDWLSSYERPRLTKIDYVKRFFKKHRASILTVAWFEIRRFFGL